MSTVIADADDVAFAKEVESLFTITNDAPGRHALALAFRWLLRLNPGDVSVPAKNLASNLYDRIQVGRHCECACNEWEFRQSIEHILEPNSAMVVDPDAGRLPISSYIAFANVLGWRVQDICCLASVLKKRRRGLEPLGIAESTIFQHGQEFRSSFADTIHNAA